MTTCQDIKETQRVEFIEKVVAAAKMLHSFSETKMPFTYHHDYIRTYNPKYTTKSRAEIAKDYREADIKDIYTIAFIYLVSIENPVNLLNLTIKQIGFIKDVLANCKYAIIHNI